MKGYPFIVCLEENNSVINGLRIEYFLFDSRGQMRQVCKLRGILGSWSDRCSLSAL